jgi:hypothetical protein
MVMAPVRLPEKGFAPTEIVCAPEPGGTVEGEVPIGVIQGEPGSGTVLQKQEVEDELTYTPANPPAADTLEVMGAIVKEQAVPNCVST